MIWYAPEPTSLDKVLADEGAAIAARRNKLAMPPPDNDLMGVALSGGGIRSATVCLGGLETLNKNCLLDKADYLSSVSGGGYTASYVHSTLCCNGADRKAFDRLFTKEDIDYLRRHDSYLAPGAGFSRVLNMFRLGGAYVYSFFMNLTWVLALFVCLVAALDWLHMGLYAWTKNCYGESLLIAAIVVFAVHFFLHVFRPWLWPIRILYGAEGILLLLAIPCATHRIYTDYAASEGFFTHILLVCQPTRQIGELFSSYLGSDHRGVTLLFFLAVLAVIGVFSNPNLLSFHRFYRDSLAAAYLKLAKGCDSHYKLSGLNPGATPADWGCAPYPLVNTCLNLLGRKDEKFAGTSSCEHFILSPLYCGSRVTGYAPSSGDAFEGMTLATAMAVAGAAVNPNMGYNSNRILAFLMTILNMRLGYWAPNPAARRLPRLTWWPWYQVMELLALTDSRKRRVSLSDGGHIENLGVFELLRRRCRLIIAIDSSADPEYGFSDLKELVIQARNILGVTIDFRVRPEELIHPDPSVGYSREHFAIADIGVLPGAPDHLKDYRGLLVYIKSSMKAPGQRKNLSDVGYVYKTYHPAFPHESTSDQFFDEPQWESYRELGMQMVEDMLRTVLEKDPDPAVTCAMTARDWYGAFDRMWGERKIC
jgi:hypothetical protein